MLLDFKTNEENESETLIKYRELCIAALDEYSVKHPNLFPGEEKKKIANDSLAAALLESGRILIQEIEDCTNGTKIIERLVNKFPQFEKTDEALFYLYGCAVKNNQPAEKNILKRQELEKRT